MTRQSLLLSLVLVVLAVLLGYNFFAQPFADLGLQDETRQEELQAEAAPEPEPSSPQQEVLSELTIKDRVSLLMAVSLTVDGQLLAEPQNSDQLVWIQSENPGMVVLFGSNIASLSATSIIDTIHTKNEEHMQGQPLVAVDHEGGSVQRLTGSGFTRLPSWQSQCAADRVATQIRLEDSAVELATAGVQVVFAPVVDIATSNRWMGSRVCGSDPVLVSDRAKLFVDVFSNKGILPVLKHFPGIGSSTRDLHTSFDRVEVQPADTQVYRSILGSRDTIGVMVSHVGVENQYPEVPCSLSSTCVGQLTQFYPQTLIISDDVTMAAAYHQPALSTPDEADSAAAAVELPQKSLDQVVYESVLAGNDVTIIGPGVGPSQLREVQQRLISEYTQSAEFQENVDQSVLKVLEYKQKLSMEEEQ